MGANEENLSLAFHSRLLSMMDEERSEFIKAAQHRYLTDETTQSRNRLICAEANKVLADCGFPQLEVILEVNEQLGEQSFVIVFRDKAKRQPAFGTPNRECLHAGLEGMCFCSRHRELCEQIDSQPLLEPAMPEVEAQWLERAKTHEKDEVTFLLDHVNSWLTQYRFPRLAGVLRLDAGRNPKLMIVPRDTSHELRMPPTFDPTIESFSPHHISEFVLGMNFARLVLS